MTETLEQRAHRWMRENPAAMFHFRRFAHVMLERRQPFGIGLLTERVRWEMVTRGGDADFKINNSFRAYIARQLVAEMPGLRDLIRCRVTKSANKPVREPVHTSPEVDPLTGTVR